MTQIEGDLTAFLDEWHSLPEVFDNTLDAQIHRWYAEALDSKPVFPKRPYFSPSSANSCPRELYMKAKGAKRDEQRKQPHQGRWTRIGTAIGDMIQRDILFAEKYFEKLTGNKPPFVFERNEQGQPMFEEFAKVNTEINWRGHSFYLYGTCDGILEYTADDDEKIRVGLEIKSKQTSSAQTSLYSMRNPSPDHVRQCIAYSAMYDVDYYVILYVNASKQGWHIPEEKAKKTPDIRAFGMAITDEHRADLFEKFADVLDALESGTPPALDLDKWTFNNFKTACAESLSDDEYADICEIVRVMRRSNLPEWKKTQYAEALEFIEKVREGL